MTESKPKLPRNPGFYWAKWRIADEGTRDGDEATPSDKWEVVEVFMNSTEPTDDEYMRVSIPGVDRSQHITNFVWGPGPLKPPEARS